MHYFIQKSLFPAFIGLIFSFIFSSCNKLNTAEIQVQNGLVFPAYFPELHYVNQENPITTEGVALGRLLFYEKKLSLDSTISCGSCHAQTHAFADHNNKVSKGVGGLLGTRSSPALFNLGWNTSFMWDGGANHIEVMPLGPFTATNEMAFTMHGVVDRLNASPYYRDAFNAVFGIDSITDQKVLYALAQFMSSMISDNSKYDEFKRGETVFTSDENAGYQLFLQHCNSCHTEPLFTDFSFRNNGFTTSGDELGRKKITLLDEDLYKFKVPSLRNIELTYPYMHNGNLRTLEDVLAHYNSLDDNELIDANLKKGTTLNAEETKQLIAFLNTLTDYEFIGNKALSEIEAPEN